MDSFEGATPGVFNLRSAWSLPILQDPDPKHPATPRRPAHPCLEEPYAGNQGVGMVQSVDLDAPAGTAPNGQACSYTCTT